MIDATTAIRTARGLLGTSYDELDCINLIKKSSAQRRAATNTTRRRAQTTSGTATARAPNIGI